MGNYTSKSVNLHFHKSIEEKVFIFDDAVVDFNGKCIKSNLYTVLITKMCMCFLFNQDKYNFLNSIF